MTSSDGVDVPGLRLGEVVGRGGFGTVYRARDEQFQRDVAVKVLDARLDEAGRARFERECAALGSISDHPHVVAVHRSGVTDQGSAYLVMELLVGGSLAARAAERPLDWAEAVDIGISLSGALATAHGAGVLHRDVKPENILFSGYGSPKLVDFGIAAVRGGYETRSSSITTSLAHAAPEIVSGASASQASDVYALASTMHFALSGSAPFVLASDESLVPLIARIATASPPDLRPLGVPDGVARVLEDAIAKDPAARPASAAVFGEQLRSAAVAAGVASPAVALVAPPRAGAPAGSPQPDGAVPPVPADTAASETSVVGRREREPSPVPEPRSSHRVVAAALVGGAVLAAGGAIAFALGRAGPTASGGLPAITATPTPGASTSGPSSVPPAASPSLSQAPEPSSTRAPTKATETRPPDPEPAVVVPPPSPQPPRATNRPPSIAAVPAQSRSELVDVSLALRGSDPDADSLAWSASNLPRGLTISRMTGVITGTVSVDAADVTRDRRFGLKSRALTSVVVVSDGDAQASRTISWTVRDTHLRMPNYYGKFGCNGDSGCAETSPYNVQAVSLASFGCTTTSPVGNERIAAQSVAAGAVHAWGARATFTYQRPSC